MTREAHHDPLSLITAMGVYPPGTKFRIYRNDGVGSNWLRCIDHVPFQSVGLVDGFDGGLCVEPDDRGFCAVCNDDSVPWRR